MCFGSSTSEHVHKLFTGGHHTSMARNNSDIRNKVEETSIEAVKKYVSTLNHVGPSYRTVLRSLGPIKIEASPHHDNLYLHTKVLEQNKDKAVYIEGYMSTRYPVSVVFDEQLLNPGVFLFKKSVPGRDKPQVFIGGLDKTVCLDDIKNDGLQVFLDKVGTELNFLKSVTEFQCLDLGNVFYSNAFTHFNSAALSETYVEVIGNLQSCLREVNVCQNCRKNGFEDCIYDDLKERCQYCIISEVKCVSLVVVHTYCDMAGAQKKAAKHYPSLYLPKKDPCQTTLITYGFGQLHNLKAIQCSSRNWSLTDGTNNHTLKIVASVYYKDNDIGNRLKAKLPSSVIIGRDKQSDEFAYRLASPDVQAALTDAETYQFSVIPEKIFEYKAGSQSHNSIKRIFSVGADQYGNMVLSALYVTF